MICHDLIESVPNPLNIRATKLPKHSNHFFRPPREVWDPREQEHPAPWAKLFHVPWLFQDPYGMLQNWEVQNGSRMPPTLNPHQYCFATQFGTSSTYPWSSMRGSRGKGSTKHWHLWWQTNSTSAWQIRNKAQTQTECFMHFTHCHGSPSPPSKPILQERNTSKQISATSELKLSFWRSEISIDIWVCVYDFVSDCLDQVGSSWIKPKQAINRSTTQAINPCKALDGWFCSLGLGGCEGLPLKELQAVCLWSV